VGDLPVIPVKYVDFAPSQARHMPIDLVVRKKKPFSYEKERRIVMKTEPPLPKGTVGSIAEHLESGRLGLPLRWDPEKYLDSVLIHPGADYAFLQTVEAVVGAMAPKLTNRIGKSGMAALPPV
jgi:hypothetical protein